MVDKHPIVIKTQYDDFVASPATPDRPLRLTAEYPDASRFRTIGEAVEFARIMSCQYDYICLRVIASYGFENERVVYE